jgi:hypothetical protein
MQGLEPFHHEHTHDDEESDDDDFDASAPTMSDERLEAQLEYYLKFQKEHEGAQEKKKRFFKYV